MADERQVVSVDGKKVTLTHLDKVVYSSGATKAVLIDYYVHVGPAIIDHLRGRPVTLRRYPDGAGAPGFWQKHCPETRPDWMRTARVSTASGKSIRYCRIEDLASLAWAVNQGTIEFHPTLHRIDDTAHPDWMVLDLDPGEGRDIVDCAELALDIRSRLEDAGLQAVVKTTGSEGLHLHVALEGKVGYEESAAYARQIARSLEKEQPERVVSKMKRSLRDGRIFVDWSQNNPNKTSVCAYSLRAGVEPCVATPVRWDEVTLAVDQCRAQILRFSPGQVVRRLEEMGDLMGPLADRQGREGALARLS